MRAETIRTSLARWRTARRVVLGSILMAGSVVTSAAVMYRMGTHPCTAAAAYEQPVERAYTYSGVGVVIERQGHDVVVRRVLPGSPAEDRLFPGARLISVDGEQPATLGGWAEAIRGAPGTAVEVEIAYPCGGHQMVTLGRDVIRMAY